MIPVGSTLTFGTILTFGSPGWGTRRVKPPTLVLPDKKCGPGTPSVIYICHYTHISPTGWIAIERSGLSGEVSGSSAVPNSRGPVGTYVGIPKAGRWEGLRDFLNPLKHHITG